MARKPSGCAYKENGSAPEQRSPQMTAMDAQGTQASTRFAEGLGQLRRSD